MYEAHAPSVKLFYSYAHEDEKMRDELAKHLGKVNISELHDRKIKAGDNWEEEIDEYLEKADIVLLLISVDFMTSDYCVSKEMKRALERHDAKQARVIPIYLRPTYLSKKAPFNYIQALPRDAKAISEWPNLDSAYTNVAEGVHRVIDEMLTNWCIADAEAYSNAKRDEEAYDAYCQALKFSPDDVNIYKKLAGRFREINRLDKAIECYHKALRLSSNEFDIYKELGNTYKELGCFSEAVGMYDQALRLQPRNVQLCLNKGEALAQDARYDEAIATYKDALKFSEKEKKFVIYDKIGDALRMAGLFDEAQEEFKKAIALDPTNFELYMHLGNTLFQYSTVYHKRALDAYGEALRIDPKNISIWRNKGNRLDDLGQLEEALKVYNEGVEMSSNDDPSLHFLYKDQGDVLCKLNRLTEALASYKNATVISPNFKAAYKGIEEVYSRMERQLKEISDVLPQQIK